MDGSNRLDKSNVKNFPILDLACLGVGWSPLTSKQIALHIGELEVFFACFFNILECGFAIEGNHGQRTDT